MLVNIEYKDYRINESSDSGGKAGRGYNKTKTMRVIEEFIGSYRIRKQFVYPVHSIIKKEEAIAKAKKWIDDNPK